MPYRRRRTRKNALYRVPRVQTARSVVKRHQYASQKVLSGTPGAYIRFWMNGIFDPDAQVGGHQPVGHDEMANFYNHYNVIASRVVATFISTSTSPSIAALATADTVSSTYTSLSQLQESGNTVWKHVSGAGGGGATRPMVTLRSGWKFPYKILGVDRNSDTARTQVGSDPSDGLFYTFWFVSIDGATVTSCQLDVYLEYIVEWSEPKPATQS